MPPELYRPLRRDARRNHELILRAASEVFATRGLAAPMDEIAERAGVGTGTLYRRFSTKAQLIEVLFEGRIQETSALAESACSSDDAWEGLCAFLTELISRLASDRGLKEALFLRSQDAVGRGARRDPLVGRDAARARETEWMRARGFPDDRCRADRAHGLGHRRSDARHSSRAVAPRAAADRRRNRAGPR